MNFHCAGALAGRGRASSEDRDCLQVAESGFEFGGIAGLGLIEADAPYIAKK
jgi:hypothetical protein